ncbi:MAG: undecaprenyl-phosphate glucose phosphotransferase [Pseudomonadota bacterium]
MLFDTAQIVRDEMRAASVDVSAGQSAAAVDVETSRLSDAAKALARSLRGASYSPAIVAGVVRVSEWLVIFATGMLVYWSYLGLEFGFSLRYTMMALGVSTAAIILFQILGLYAPHAMRSVGHQGLRLVAGWTTLFAAMLTFGFFTNLGDHVSRLWVGLWFSLGLLALMMFRSILVVLINRWMAQGRLMRHAVLVGGGEHTEKLILALRASSTNDLNLLGFFDDRGEDRSEESCEGLQKLGTVDDLVEFARIAPLDLVIVTIPVTAESRVLNMVRKLWVLPVDVRLSAHTTKLRFRPRAYSYIGNVPFFAVFDRPLADWDHVAKAALDRVLGGLMLIALSPLLLAVAVAVKLDSKGPVLFRQKRFGFNNEPIEIFKFRSMYTDRCDPNAKEVVTRNDPRVTRVGAFIRRTSLDELPQLFNVVFKGDLSLVGPRPHAVRGHLSGTPFDKVIDGYFARHRVKPGMSGWAQVNGWRGEMDTTEKIERRVEHDLYYIENWSILFDLQIIAMTPLALLTQRENAY